MNQLKKLAEASGVEYIDRGNGHIQLRGALLVNYYPTSKRRSAYVAGTKNSRRHVSPAEAIAMCNQPPPKLKKTQRVKRKQNYKKVRAAMHRRGLNSCHWCGKPLTLETSTLDHVIPLYRGGLDHDNNRVLACHECNHDRGHEMPEVSNG